MLISHLLILISILKTCLGSTPETSCGNIRPFKGRDNNCYDFKDVCVKTDDAECQSFLNSCEQCPANKTIILKLVDYLNNCRNQSQLGAQIDNLNERIKQQSNVQQLETDKLQTQNVFLDKKITTVIIINCILLCLGILIAAVSLINSKSFRHRRREYILLDDKNSHEQREAPVVTPSNADKPNIKFKFNNNSRPVELFVHKTELIIKVKRRICQECDLIRPDDYKIMKLRYNDKLLDDNQYLLSFVRGENSTVDCELDNTVDKRDIIVLQLTGKMQVPEMVQMNKNQTIADMKKLIFSTENVREFATFSGNMKLEDKLSLNQCNLRDDDLIHLVDMQQRHLIIIFVFGDRDPLVVQYRNTDLVSDVKREISDKLNMIPDEFILLSEKEYLNEEKHIFQYDIANGSEIRCCSWKRLGENIEKSLVQVEKDCIHVHYSFDIYENTKIGVWLYNFTTISGIRESKALVNEINKYLKMKNNPRFLKLYGFFHKDNLFYLTLDFMEGKSIHQYSEDKQPLNESEIAKFSKQILEALRYFHDNNMVYRFLAAKNIWIEDGETVKIAPVGFTKYLYGCDAREMIAEFIKCGDRKNLSMPPEVNNGGTFEMASDVWQFGTIVYQMIAKKSVYSGMSVVEMTRSIENYSNIEYISSNPKISSELKYFMEQCLKGQPEDRPTVQLLLLDPFINTS